MDLSDLIKRIGIKSSTKRNEALNTYIENSDKKREKLEMLLSEFLRITSDKSAPDLKRSGWVENYYNYIYNNINNFDFNIFDVNQLTSNVQPYIKDDPSNNSKFGLFLSALKDDPSNNSKFGLFLSALINKNIKGGEKIQIITSIPIHYLFYKLENPEAYVNIAGAGLGLFADNSKIYADKAGDDAGYNMQNCELHVKKAGDWLGSGAINSTIYAYEVEDYAGYNIQSCELHVKKAGNRLGADAKNSKVYADEAGINAGSNMKNSELFIYKLNGNLADSCFEGNNEIYLGEESYKKLIQDYPKYINKVKLWEKTT
ncbi:hypothetical protein IG206_02120 [Candidatus Parvarchaeota archaeon]|nr:hypothetical protein [Candidatus Acidifodinimicrobium mancum]